MQSNRWGLRSKEPMPLDLLGSLNVFGTPLARPPHVATRANVGRFLEERWPIPVLPKPERDERGLSAFGGPSDFFQEGVVTAPRHSETIDEALHNLFSDRLSA